MSRCGNCRRICSCQLLSSETVSVLGTGSDIGSRYQVRPNTLPPSFRWVGNCFQVSTSQVFSANTDTAINFDTDALQITGGNMWDASMPTRLTAAIDGLYLIGGNANRVGIPALWHVWIAKNGVPSAPLVKTTTTLGPDDDWFFCFNSVMTMVRLNAGDYIELYIRSDSSSITNFGTIGVGSLDNVSGAPHMYAQWIDD